MGSLSLELIMNGLVVLAACVCACTGQVLVNPARAIYPGQSHQFHAQDEFGQFSFGHAGGPSARTESRAANGVTQGSYQYVDANGLLQTVNYIADPFNGFRVSGTNLPAAPLAPAVVALEGPAPVQETAEVAAARAEHLAAVDAAAAAAAAAPEERKKREAILPYPYAAGLAAYPYAAGLAAYPYGAGLLASAPADIVANIAPAPPVTGAYAALPAVGYAGAALAAETVSAPAAREATLTTVKLNPGHAVSYRVD